MSDPASGHKPSMTDDPGIAARFAVQHGLITRAQALDLGLSSSAIQFLIRRGEWVVVRRGVYADTAAWHELDDHRGKPLMRARGAVMTMRRGWVLSHDSAAHALGMAILRSDPAFVHITRPGVTNAWTKTGVKHHLARYTPEQVVTAEGLPSLDWARTAVDIAREHGVIAGTVAADSAMQHGVSRSALVLAHEPFMRCWPGVTAVRRSVALADGDAESPGETLLRLLVVEMAIGEPHTQFPVRLADGRLFWCDLRVGNHLFEFDGLIKYRRPEAGGIATDDPDQVVIQERQRERLICAEGFGMSRVVWAELWGAARTSTKARLAAEVAVTRDRFGDEVPAHRLELAARLSRRRRAA